MPTVSKILYKTTLQKKFIVFVFYTFCIFVLGFRTIQKSKFKVDTLFFMKKGILGMNNFNFILNLKILFKNHLHLQ